jgi:hypothetical protein
MRKRFGIMTLATGLTLIGTMGAPAPTMATQEFFAAKLRGGTETPVAVATDGSGVWGAQLDNAESALTFQLFYDLLEGGAVSAAHIHLGAPGTSGGIVIHLCGSGGTAACPAPPGFVTGVITSANVVAVPAQGVDAGNLAQVIQAMRKGDTYVNVHTGSFPGGEIRGRIE